MNIIIGFLLALVFFGVVVLKLAVEMQKTSKRGVRGGALPVEAGHYRVRGSVLTRSEMAFFDELTRQLPTGYHVFPKMRIADILETTARGGDYYRQRNKILPKHIDFVVCNQYFKPVLAIEVNGSSHRYSKTQASDALKKEIFEVVGMPLEIVAVGSNFKEIIEKINLY